MCFMIILLRIIKLQAITHRGGMFDAHKVIIPRACFGNHVKPLKSVTQKKLDLLIVCWGISCGVSTAVLVLSAPLITTWRELVRCQRARPGCKRARQDYTSLSVPRSVCLQHTCVRDDIGCGELWSFVRLCMQPTQRLEILQIVMFRQRR